MIFWSLFFFIYLFIFCVYFELFRVKRLNILIKQEHKQEPNKPLTVKIKLDDVGAPNISGWLQYKS